MFAEWRRSIGVDPALLHAGTNTVTIALDGAVHLDRLQMEMSYAAPSATPARSRDRAR